MAEQTFEQRFAEHLLDLARTDDRAALAALRRGLGKEPGTEPRMYPYVVPWLPRREPDSKSAWSAEQLERRCFLVAALFAAHPVEWPGNDRPANLGTSFGVLAHDANSESIERRFLTLLRANEEDLPEHLRHAVSLLRSHSVPVDWAQLLRDLRGWGHPDNYVQRAWARSYFQRRNAQPD